MHHKVKKKLLSATKLYLIVPEHEKAIQIKIQLPNAEYVQIDLNQPFPKKFEYLTLSHGGFNYDAAYDTPIIRYYSRNTIDVLRKSINYRNNSEATILELITLIEMLPNHI